jgi:hypothetical protein
MPQSMMNWNDNMRKRNLLAQQNGIDMPLFYQTNYSNEPRLQEKSSMKGIRHPNRRSLAGLNKGGKKLGSSIEARPDRVSTR